MFKIRMTKINVLNFVRRRRIEFWICFEFRYLDFGFKHLQNKVEIILKET